jgi:hypothetical protein
MVRAILDGRKTVTRRIIKTAEDVLNSPYIKSHPETPDAHVITKLIEPPYHPGDILYVKETVWQKVGHFLDVDSETKYVFYNEFRYVATDGKPEDEWNHVWVKRPSIHMQKKAARIWLKVTDVRAARLQDIVVADPRQTIHNICAEGLQLQPVMENYEKLIDDFKTLWNSTIKKSDLYRYGWKANPWVWVIEFERCEKPDKLGLI